MSPHQLLIDHRGKLAFGNSSLAVLYATWRNKYNDSATESLPVIDEYGLFHPEILPASKWKIHRNHFQTRITEHVQQFWAPLDQFRTIDTFSNSTSFEAYLNIVRFACQNDIDLYIVISPVHAYMAEAMRFAGLTVVWERWVKEIVSDSEAEAQK